MPPITEPFTLVRRRKSRSDTSPLSTRFDMYMIHLTQPSTQRKPPPQRKDTKNNVRTHNAAQPNPHRRRHPQKRHRQKRRPALANAKERNGLLRASDETHRSQTSLIPQLSLISKRRTRTPSSKNPPKRSPHGPQNLVLHPPALPPPQRPHEYRHFLATPLRPPRNHRRSDSLLFHPSRFARSRG